ncbi:MAG: lipoyl synthase [Bacteroidales bacterium]|nr:lipoyl synthase [Bacteroidales bacterium]
MAEKKLVNSRRKPDWLKVKNPIGSSYSEVYKLLNEQHVHTICVSGKCPNIGECWSNKTATFMILGDVCTRACKFCNVKTGKGEQPDPEEPKHIAHSVKSLGVKHVVLTSVDRDDLPDLGVGHWCNVIREIKQQNPDVTMEALIPDFQAKAELVQKVIDTGVEVISHNLETVRSLTESVRSRAKYESSLKVIQQIAQSPARAKSGIMVGLGETDQEVYECMDDLLEEGCEVLTIGQYLQPTRKHLEVNRYVSPGKFKQYEQTGLQKGFCHVESSPLVRSSYHAHKHIK